MEFDYQENKEDKYNLKKLQKLLDPHENGTIEKETIVHFFSLKGFLSYSSVVELAEEQTGGMSRRFTNAQTIQRYKSKNKKIQSPTQSEGNMSN